MARMLSVRVEQELAGYSALAKAIIALGEKEMTEILATIGEEIKAETNALISAELINDRPPKRRKKGQRHFKGSIVVDIKSTTFPMTIVVRSLAEKHKVGTLEFGSPPHKIKGNPWLAFPKGAASTSVGPMKFKAHRRIAAYGGPRSYGKTAEMRVVHEVWHPGQPIPGNYMKRGLNRALEKRLRGARIT